MLTARRIIVAAFVIAVLSLAGIVWQLASPPDSGGLARDSYGTRAFGQKALYELLRQLNLPVERGLVPPTGLLRLNVCMALLSPDPELIRTEPDHIRKVGQWVRDGGVTVVAPSALRDTVKRPYMRPRPPFTSDTTVLAELGLPDVALATIGESTVKAGGGRAPSPESERDEDEMNSVWGMREVRPPLLRSVPVSADGELAFLDGLVTHLQVPSADLQVIGTTSTAATSGRIVWRDENGEERVLAALYSVGRGRVAVVGDPAILCNFSIAGDDNAVLAAHLLARSGRPIVLDEFYHGLTVRGNPVWLLTRYPYGLMTALLVLATAIWAWRGAVFLGPPLAEQRVRRRTLREYVEAMANLLQRSNCRPFILREVRDGVLWALCKKLHLSPREEKVETVAQALRRKNPELAARLVRAVQATDDLLGESERPKKHLLVHAAKDLTQCL